MIVSTCGYGSTGSSAVSDYLKECDNTQVLDRFEFPLVSGVDGLHDLAYHLMEKNTRQTESISAIQRFQVYVQNHILGWHRAYGISKDEVERCTEEFLDSITQIKYVGLSPRIYKGGSKLLNKYVGRAIIMKRILRPLEKKGIIKKNLDIYPFDTVRYTSCPDNFYVAARHYTRRLLEGMGADFSKIIVMDQALSGSDPESGFPFYDDPYAIVVDRDPRDIYIFAKRVLLSAGRFMPTEKVEDFVVYYRNIRRKKPVETERCLPIRFEDLVYHYEQTANRIDSFLRIHNTHRKTIFVPEQSAANTNLIRRFPEFSSDVALIEKELPEYLFDFSQCQDMGSGGKMFYGVSPLNKR